MSTPSRPETAAPAPVPSHPDGTGLPADHPLADGRTAHAPLVDAYRGRTPSRRPVWFMRQAGRSLPEYRAARAGTAMLDACLTPDLASEITLQPVRRHDVDAAIFFSDIVIPLRLAGVDVDIHPGVGPVMGSAVRTAADVERLLAECPVEALTPEVLAPVTEAVRLTTVSLGSTPLIGFAGAPFTLAAYLVEGRPSRDHLAARTLMHADPDAWRALTTWAADVTGTFLRAQVLAGASAAQLFDSWAGSLSLADYTARVAPASTRALSRIGDLGVPRVHFGTGTGELLAPTWSAWTTGCRWTRPPAGSAVARRCRATSTPPCSPPPGRCWRRTCATWSPAVRRPPATWSTSATACPRPPIPRC
jgi:uroporphyrinogen decarboxylase